MQAQLAAKAPPRKRSTNQPQQAMLRGLLTDPQGRPMVPTYGSSKVRRYAHYETRKDLARPGDVPGIRYQRGQLERHLIAHLEELLNDEHALRRLSWLSPRIVEAIADGTQPSGLTRRALLICELPLAWSEQERQFGMAA